MSTSGVPLLQWSVLVRCCRVGEGGRVGKVGFEQQTSTNQPGHPLTVGRGGCHGLHNRALGDKCLLFIAALPQ